MPFSKKTSVVNTRVSGKVKRELDRNAAKSGITTSAYIRVLIEQDLAKEPKK